MESNPEKESNSIISFPALPPPPAPKKKRSLTVLLALLLVGLLAGGIIGYAVTYTQFNSKLDNLQAQLGLYQGSSGPGSTQTYVLDENVSLADLYQYVKGSVVVVQDLAPDMFFGQRVYTLQQGSGFVVQVNGEKVVVTNNHVIEGTINVTVTFADGTCVPASVLGQDAKADLAVLSVPDMPNGIAALSMVSSVTLTVGDPVVAVGSPYGLAGTLTTGIVSALGRTIMEDDSENGVQIPDTIQTSTAINPGNSGGPLLNYVGKVVGITTAGIADSQGLGFAIPSATIMREINSLVSTGGYDKHPSINAQGTDMNYPIAQAMGAPVSYGVLIEKVGSQNGLQGGTQTIAVLNQNVVVGGDIIIGAGNVRIANTDDLLSYLERNTLPGQTVDFTVVRNGQTRIVAVLISNA